MNNMIGIPSLAALAATLLAGPTMAADPAIQAAWQEHKANFTYFGITSNYSCSGMEGKVKQILLQLGARKDDLHVNASACGPRDLPYGRMLNVDVRFSTLVPVDPAAAPGTSPAVVAQWAAVEVQPNRPSSMGEGDCELIEQLHDLVGKNFTSRSLDYRASCTPHQLGINSYGVHGEFLKVPKA